MEIAAVTTSDVSPTHWARTEAERLRSVAESPNSPGARQVTVQAIQFLTDHAASSSFQGLAIHSIARYSDNAGAIRAVAFQLDEWATYEESGVSHQKPFEVRFRIEAATDIMEQAQMLLSEKNIHPAAPVVLAGAALEEISPVIAGRVRRTNRRQTRNRGVFGCPAQS